MRVGEDAHRFGPSENHVLHGVGDETPHVIRRAPDSAHILPLGYFRYTGRVDSLSSPARWGRSPSWGPRLGESRRAARPR